MQIGRRIAVLIGLTAAMAACGADNEEFEAADEQADEEEGEDSAALGRERIKLSDNSNLKLSDANFRFDPSGNRMTTFYSVRRGSGYFTNDHQRTACLKKIDGVNYLGVRINDECKVNLGIRDSGCFECPDYRPLTADQVASDTTKQDDYVWNLIPWHDGRGFHIRAKAASEREGTHRCLVAKRKGKNGRGRRTKEVVVRDCEGPERTRWQFHGYLPYTQRPTNDQASLKILDTRRSDNAWLDRTDNRKLELEFSKSWRDFALVY
ncbi:MAG TPA: hypothetical protein VM580_02235 [Labilithrix sp.]|nr:hypothetical protein [Labilithrix sp.]